MTSEERVAALKKAEEQKATKIHLFELSTRELKFLDHLMSKTNDLDSGAEVLYTTLKENLYETLGRIERMDFQTLLHMDIRWREMQDIDNL